MKRFLSVPVLALVVFVSTGCDDRSAQNTAPPAATPAEPLPANLMAAAAPANAKGVAEVRKVAADGDAVVVRGRIAGQENPFTEGRAQFQLVDLGVRSCAEMPDDKCPTPWDMCCEDKKDIAANSVTVQVVGEDGKPLKATLDGVGGLKPLSEVSVKGKLKKSPDGNSVMVNATELYVKQG
jgi:hypothetical protein